MSSDDGSAVTHTFLFADLAGYTALTEAHGDEHAADVAAAFCEAVRAMLPDHKAQEVKALGDALMIHAPEAAKAAGLAERIVCEQGARHRALAVRVGMHTGTAVRRGDDWFGSAVNIAARVADLASPGEVLCTAATRDALGRAVPIRSRGPQRLKNVAEPITVYELVVQGPLGDLPVDPVCRMAVDPARAVARREVERKTYYFCSEGCADAFDADPGAYLEGAERGTH